MMQDSWTVGQQDRTGQMMLDTSLLNQPQVSLLPHRRNRSSWPPPPPPPPPLLPCPALSQPSLQPADSLPTISNEPIDYSMKRQSPSPSASQSRSRSRSPQQILTLRLLPPYVPELPVTATAASSAPPTDLQSQSGSSALDPLMQDRATKAAEIIRRKLEGHGRRIHTFLGVILHSSLKPSSADQDFESLDDTIALTEVAVFCDERRKPIGRPSNYFLVLNTQMLALIWCKFKGNSSAEFSTLTRAIRSSRQKYRGIFESVGTPCKKLYKFGDLAMSEFQKQYPHCYSS